LEKHDESGTSNVIYNLKVSWKKIGYENIGFSLDFAQAVG
jgi:hypothetical protein